MDTLTNPETEQALLGSLLIDPLTIPRVAPVVRADDFSEERHRWIYEAICAAGENADFLTVCNALKHAGKLDEAGGEPYVVQLTNAVPTALNVMRYAETVADLGKRRRVLLACSAIARAAGDHERPTSDILDVAIREVGKALGNRRAPTRPLIEIAEDALTDFEERLRDPHALRGIPFGLPDLDRLLGGLQVGRLITVAGRPGMGKSALMAQAALYAAGAGRRVALFSLEMGDAEIFARMAKAYAGVGFAHGEEDKLTQAQRDKLRAAHSAIAKLPLHIFAGAHRVSDIVAECELLKHGGLALVIVDYLQIAVPDVGQRVNATRDLELSSATRALKLLAMRLSVPVLIGSQLNRQAENVKPTLGMLRESGGIEADSDAVIMLWCPDEAQGNVIEAVVAKNRNGRTGAVKLYFDKPTYRFGLVAKG